MKNNYEKEYIEIVKDVEKGKISMLEGPEDTRKYLLHNKQRFIRVLQEIDNVGSRDNNIKNLRILDIGISPFTFWLRIRYPEAEIYAIDYTDKHKGEVERVGIRFKRVDLNTKNVSLFREKFDVITFLEVLEHLSGSHQKVLKMIIESMKIGGVCILQTPNKHSPKAVVFSSHILIWFWDKFSQRKKLSLEYTHYKEYSLGELNTLLNKFSEIEVTHSEHDMYFDVLESTMVYRDTDWIRGVLKLNQFVLTKIPYLRRGMQVVFRKINPEESNSPAIENAHHRFGLRPFDQVSEVITSQVDEVQEITESYLRAPAKNLCVIDMGSGRGEYSYEMSQRFLSVVGVEPYKKACDVAADRYTSKQNLSFVNKKIEDYTPRKKVDVVVALTVFEHMSSPRKSFDQITKILKVGGIVYLTAPNRYWPIEQHYGLFALSWLPLRWANVYLNSLRAVPSYEDCSYARGYLGMRKFFDELDVQYEFILPIDGGSGYLDCGKQKLTSSILRNIGFALIKFHPIFWVFSKGFIMVIKNKKTTKYSGVNFAKKVRETFPNFSLITYTHELENELKGCRSILDVGCGKNSPLRLMSKMYTKTGVDGFISAISESKKKGIHDDYYHMYIKGLGKKFKSNSYDAVVALDVIEHLTRKDGERLLRDMERVARKKVILVTPNGFVPQHKKENLLEEHLSGWTKNDFTKKGYKVKGVYGWKALRKHGAEIVYEPKILVGLLSELTHYFWTRRSVKHSYSLMASKTI